MNRFKRTNIQVTVQENLLSLTNLTERPICANEFAWMTS